jgi:WD40 repeat protein
MFCNYCGSPIPGGAKFCRNCGKPIAQSQQPSAAAPTPVIPRPATESDAETIQAPPVAVGAVPPAPSAPSATEPRKVRAGRRTAAAVAVSIGVLLIGALILMRGRSGPRRLVGHSQSVTSLAFSRDGRMLASGSVDGTVKLWDMTLGKWLRTLPSYQSAIWVAFSPDGQIASSGGALGHGLMLWDAASGNQRLVLASDGDSVGPTEFSPDGRLLVATVNSRGGNDVELRMWEAASGKELRRLPGFSAPKFSPDGKLMAAWNKVHSISLLDVESGNEVRTFDENFAYPEVIIFSPDGRLLASMTHNSTMVTVWDVASGKKVRDIGDSETVRGLAFSPDSRLLAVGSGDHTIKLWDVVSGNKVRTLSGHSDSVNCVAFSPDGRWLASGGDDSKILLWPLSESP